MFRQDFAIWVLIYCPNMSSCCFLRACHLKSSGYIFISSCLHLGCFLSRGFLRPCYARAFYRIACDTMVAIFLEGRLIYGFLLHFSILILSSILHQLLFRGSVHTVMRMSYPFFIHVDSECSLISDVAARSNPSEPLSFS